MQGTQCCATRRICRGGYADERGRRARHALARRGMDAVRPRTSLSCPGRLASRTDTAPLAPCSAPIACSTCSRHVARRSCSRHDGVPLAHPRHARCNERQGPGTISPAAACRRAARCHEAALAPRRRAIPVVRSLACAIAYDPIRPSHSAVALGARRRGSSLAVRADSTTRQLNVVARRA